MMPARSRMVALLRYRRADRGIEVAWEAGPCVGLAEGWRGWWRFGRRDNNSRTGCYSTDY